MILKKPYAYLIKYFKVIHLAITILLCLIIREGYSIYGFFNSYVQNNYTTSITIGLADEYIPFTLYLKIIIILILIGVIIVLLIHKKKPNILYFGVVIYYIAYLVFLVYISSVLKNFEYALLASTTARTLRDITLLVLLPQLVFIVLLGLRALGFNVKKFNFSKDIKELQLAEGDSEEVEVNINFDTYKAKRGFRRAFRELIYYIKENKFMVGVIVAVVAVVSLFFIYSSSSTNFDSTYKVGTPFVYERLQITVKDAILSNVNYRGAIIKKGNYYLALKLNVKNNTGDSITLDYNKFKIIIGGVGLTPNNGYVKNFLDYNSPTIPTLITSKTDEDIILIYEMDEQIINKSMKVQLYNGSVYQNGEYYDKNIFISLKPKIYSDKENVTNYKIKDTITLENTFLGNTSIKPTSVNIAKNQTYTYTGCNRQGECQEYKNMITSSMTGGRSDNYILLLNADFVLDKDSAYGRTYNSYSEFAKNFMSIQYKIGDKVVSDKSINVTPEEKGINFFGFF